MSIELNYDVSKKTEVSLLKIYYKREPTNWDGTLFDVSVEVGRDSACDVRIQYDGDDSALYKLISKKHAELHLSHRGVFVRDLNSKNGTFIGNTRLDPEKWAQVNERDCVSLGWYVEWNNCMQMVFIKMVLLLQPL